ncbi:MAG TPA: hypothetical protein VJR89_19800 [Polyangiales bacterium]|nr:hypothetical protein [Polyangiales bacterium]
MGVRLCTAVAIFTLACTSAPSAPEMPAAVVALADQYENPTAALNASTARVALDRSLAVRGVLEAISGLAFIRDVIDDATSLTQNNLDLSVDVQGTLDAHSACPGWAPGAAPDEALNGFIEVAIGIEASRLQRAFSGRTERCRFVTELAGVSTNGVADMELEIDLGSSLGFGDPTPPILVRATNLSGMVGSVALSLGAQVVSFRFREDDAIETLVDLSTLRPDLSGSALLTLRDDGRWGLRARDGEWVCGSRGSDPCVLDAAP